MSTTPDKPRLLHKDSTHAYIQRRVEREDNAEWSRLETAERRMIFDQQRAIDVHRMHDLRERKALPKRLGAVLAEMLLLQEETRAAGYEPRVKGGEAGEVKLSEVPLVDDWTDRFRSIIRQAEAELDVALGRVSHKRDSGKERDQRILREYEGDTPELAAIREGCSASHIEKLRRRNDRRGRDGRMREAA